MRSCMSLWCAVQIHYNIDDGCVFIFVECLTRCRIGPGRTDRTFLLVCVWIFESVMFVFDNIEVVNVTIMCCLNTLQWRWRLCDYVRWMYEIVSCWPRANRKCVCNVDSTISFVLFRCSIYELMNLTLMWCPNNYNVNNNGGSAIMFVEFM